MLDSALIVLPPCLVVSLATQIIPTAEESLLQMGTYECLQGMEAGLRKQDRAPSTRTAHTEDPKFKGPSAVCLKITTVIRQRVFCE